MFSLSRALILFFVTFEVEVQHRNWPFCFWFSKPAQWTLTRWHPSVCLVLSPGLYFYRVRLDNKSISSILFRIFILIWCYLFWLVWFFEDWFNLYYVDLFSFPPSAQRYFWFKVRFTLIPWVWAPSFEKLRQFEGFTWVLAA